MPTDQDGHRSSELNRRARTFLNDQLCRLIREQAAKQGISMSTLLTAKRSLNVESRTIDRRAIWYLPQAA
jgi:hypothetical protein